MLPGSLTVDGKSVDVACDGGEWLTVVYKQCMGNYPKFYKMDILARLAFVATEKTLSNSPLKEEDKKPAIILFNHSSSVVADRQFFDTIRDAASSSTRFAMPRTTSPALPSSSTPCRTSRQARWRYVITCAARPLSTSFPSETRH